MIEDYKHKFEPTDIFPVPTTSTGMPTPNLPTVFPTPTHTHGGHAHRHYWEHVESAGAAGHRTLWVVFAIMLVSTLAFTAMGFRVSVERRLFHILTAFITLFATASYYAMAVGDGISIHRIPGADYHSDHYLARQVYWARYVDWSVTTPLLLLDLAFLAGLNGASILVVLVADIFMVLTGLFAAFGRTEKSAWGYYAMACVAYLVIVYQLALNGRNAVKSKDTKTAQLFGSLAGFTLLLWTAYPIVWGVADGARIANPDQEIIAYAVLDVLAKPIFGFWLLLSHDFSSATSISIGGFWAHGADAAGSIRVGDDDEGA